MKIKMDDVVGNFLNQKEKKKKEKYNELKYK